MTVAELAAALIRVFEGLRLEAYPDPGGVPTIGFGHTLGVKLGDTCTLQQATAWLADDSAYLFRLVAGKPILEAAALISFGYNCGATALSHVETGAAPITQFVHDRKGNVQPGLVSRRALEGALINVSRSLAA